MIDAGQQWMQSADCKDALLAALPHEDALDHIFSCEIDRPLQDWILSAHSPKILVADVEEMDKALVFDLRSKASVMRPKASNVFCGWVCHSVFSGCKYFQEIFMKGLLCGGWSRVVGQRQVLLNCGYGRLRSENAISCLHHKSYLDSQSIIHQFILLNEVPLQLAQEAE